MPDFDRMKGALAAFIDAAMSRVDYHALYPAKVVSQSGTTVDVVVDDARFGSITKVPIRTFAPDVVVTVSPNARVLIGFEGGSPQAPYASLWQSGAIVSVAIAGDTDAVALASRVDALELAVTGHVHTSAAPGSPTSTPTYSPTALPPPLGYASTKLLIGS